MTEYVKITVMVPRDKVNISASPQRFVDTEEFWGCKIENITWEPNVDEVTIEPNADLEVIDWDDSIIDSWAIEDFNRS